MSWLSWIDQIATQLGMQVLAVAGVLFSFLGARSLTRGDRGRKAWGMVAGGIAISFAMGAMSFFVYRTLEGILPQDDAKLFQILPEDWGSQMSPAERESNSLGYARMAYTNARKIVKYVDQTGVWKDYCPTPEDAARIAKFAEIRAEARAVASAGWRSALSWWVSGALALLAGAALGRRAKVAG